MTVTDDADRVNFAGNYAETFDADPSPDFDGMEYDDYRTGPKCGGPRYIDQMTANDYTDGRNVGCLGCRHCCPPDADAIPTGFEPWDRPDFNRVRSSLISLARLGYALSPHPIDCPAGRACFLRMIGHNVRLQRAARRKLDIICDECETHSEAVARYEAWATVARTKCYSAS
jgi:hypothetical protein